MNIAQKILKNQSVVILLTVLMVVFGVVSFQGLGRLAYPSFTIKKALIATPYPGASAREVEDEVTDVIEETVQSLGQLDFVTSTSQEGMSIVSVEIKAEHKSAEIPQIWDELRRKINDCQSQLPPGAGPSSVNDDFGDVFGVMFAVTGEHQSYAALKKYAQSLKKELLLVDDVAKIDLWGNQREVIYVEFSRAKMSQLGISPEQIFQTIQSQNLVQPAGKVKFGPEYIRFDPSGELTGEKAIAELFVAGQDGRLFRIADIAQVTRGYPDPPKNLMRFNGNPAIGLGISTEDGGNVVRMGEAVLERLKELEGIRPQGIQVEVVNFQAARVTESLNDFLVNLAESVTIVIALLLLFMGLRSGLLIGFILLLNILGTFIGMAIWKIDLQLLSLGALVLALGLLVDNAIVVTDVFLIKIQSGLDRRRAAEVAVGTTVWPLLGATLVAIMAFGPVGLNPENTGEFCRSLFDVMAISLFLSWILAITVTPLACVYFLPAPRKISDNPYDTPWYRRFRAALRASIRRRWLVLAGLVGVLVVSMIGFGLVPKSFFTDSTRNQFFVDYWRPEGAHIMEVEKDLARIQAHVSAMEGVENVTTFVGEGSLRFLLSYNYQSPDSSYGQLLIQVKDHQAIGGLMDRIDQYLRREFPVAEAKVNRFPEGPPVEYKIEARFRGPDAALLREIADQAKTVLVADGGARNIRDNWRQPKKTFQPKYLEVQGRRSGISRSDLDRALRWNFSGLTLGVYREGDELLPIITRPPDQERLSLANFENLQVWSTPLKRFLPIKQVVEQLETVEELSLIKRRNRMPTITVQCDPISGQASVLENRIKPLIQAIPLPLGYSLEWGGESEASQKGQAALRELFPVFLLGMFVVVVGLFNSFRVPIIIFLCVPLAIIGVTLGLLIFHMPFGFMAILGFLGLTGMLIKNSIVLIDQINAEIELGKPGFQAVLDATVSRLRPVTMAAGTTIFGMAPLLFHLFFQSMAATIMGGLLVATVLTLIIVPILYTIFYRIKPE